MGPRVLIVEDDDIHGIVPGLECVASVHGHVDILAVVAGLGKCPRVLIR